MAQRNSSGRGATAAKRQAGNRTAAKTEISELRVDEIRKRLRAHGITGISRLRKPELVQELVRAERRGGGAAKRSTGPAGRAAPGGRRTTPARARKSTPGARKSTSAARKSTPAARKSTAGARKSTAGRASQTATSRGEQATPARANQAARAKPAGPTAKPGEIRARSTSARSARGATSRTTSAAGRAGAAGEGIRTGARTARSVRSSQQIVSPDDQPERPGRSLVTTNHEVIQRWARARKAKPATIAGTERDGRVGVLTFDFPGYRESGRLRQITWDEWFQTFDERRLNLIYQEQLQNGQPSNFFRTESPDREDA